MLRQFTDPPPIRVVSTIYLICLFAYGLIVRCSEFRRSMSTIRGDRKSLVRYAGRTFVEDWMQYTFRIAQGTSENSDTFRSPLVEGL